MATAPLDQQLCFSLYAASMAVNRACKPVLDSLGITYPQYLVLLALWDQDARTVGAIGTRLGLDSSTVTPLVKRLEAGGLVTRARNPDDERQVVVSLSQRGHDIRTECGAVADTLLSRSGLSPARLLDLNKDVQALRSALSGPVDD